MRRLDRTELTFQYADPESTLRRDIDKFVVDLEPTGTLPQRPTHHFCATTRLNRIVSAQILSVPIWFKEPLLGEKFYDLEKQFARGATKRNYKKNIPSWMISRTVKWMVQNTKYRIFFAWSDSTLGEFGKVYRASNWIYLGNSWGDTNKPPKHKWMYFKGDSKKQTKELIKAYQSSSNVWPRMRK